MPKGSEEGIIKGIYLLDTVGKSKRQVNLLGSGTILEQVRAAAALLADKFDVASNVYSATPFNELGRDAIDCDRHNMLHPEGEQRTAYITQVLNESHGGPTIAATDYIKAYAEQVRAAVPGAYRVLGTDGYGRSDSRENLRRHFEVDANYVAFAALYELAKAGDFPKKDLAKAIETLGIDADKINPLYA
jgi:pyruvate dehydrogenase E1 component